MEGQIEQLTTQLQQLYHEHAAMAQQFATAQQQLTTTQHQLAQMQQQPQHASGAAALGPKLKLPKPPVFTGRNREPTPQNWTYQMENFLRRKFWGVLVNTVEKATCCRQCVDRLHQRCVDKTPLIQPVNRFIRYPLLCIGVDGIGR